MRPMVPNPSSSPLIGRSIDDDHIGGGGRRRKRSRRFFPGEGLSRNQPSLVLGIVVVVALSWLLLVPRGGKGREARVNMSIRRGGGEKKDQKLPQITLWGKGEQIT